MMKSIGRIFFCALLFLGSCKKSTTSGTDNENLIYSKQFTNTGDENQAEGNFKSAIENYSFALSLSPNYAIAYCNRGKAKKELKDFEGALADYNKAIEIDPNLFEAYLNRSVIKGLYQDTVGEESDIRKALQLNPNFAEGYNALGVVYRKKGQFEIAIQMYTKAISFQSNNPIFFNNRGMAKRKLFDFDGAPKDLPEKFRSQILLQAMPV